ncbi:hypothetical protein D2H34_004560 [Vibrio fluvialis]
MTPIKHGQDNLVCNLLTSASHGPITAADFAYQPTESNSVAHINLVMDQLVIAGCMTQTEDGRYLTSKQGERMIFNLATEM